jgi:cysteinyl-tRNA synthetase
MQGEFRIFGRADHDTMARRNYVTQDILRRIMTDYFGYDVHFVMNITDIDNKVRS